MVSCVLLVTGVASGWITASLQTASLLATMRLNAAATVRDLADRVARELLVDDYAELETLLVRSIELPDVRRLQVLEPDGAQIWDVAREAGHAPTARTGLGHLTVPPTRAPHTTVQGERLIIWQPVEAGRPLGWLRAEVSLSAIRAEQARTWGTSLLLAMVWVVTSALLIILILRPLVGAIARLTEFSKLLGERTGGQISLEGQPIEIVELGASLNEASSKLQATERQIRKLNLELEQRVAERTAQLEAANQELEAFCYSVSHDLRAPLRHVDGFIHLLRRSIEATLGEADRRNMEAISKAAGQMAKLIDDLLAFSRIGRSELQSAPVDLGALVAEIVREVGPDLRGRNVAWRVDGLPVVRGDRSMLRVVMSNLVLNALKFTRRRDVAEIEIGCIPAAGEETVVFVRDNGAGFDMAYGHKLFGVFQRLHRAEDFDGTGIGLANVRRVINRHGGRTWAEGVVDGGATFFFSLPRAGAGRLPAAGPGGEAS